MKNDRFLPKIYIHCGLHKTGTTSLQRCFAQHSGLLHSFGLLYPVTGRGSQYPGHHNIAWQIARDRRFELSGGNVEGLLAEIAGFAGSVILSSEDFETSIGNPECWSAFVKKLGTLGRPIVVIVYLRNQTAYLESLYQENLKHGCGDEFRSCAQRVLSYASLRFNEQVFHFDYERLALSLMRHDGFDVVFRNFHALAGNSLISDLISVGALPASAVRDMALEAANGRDSPLLALRNFYRNRSRKMLVQSDVDALRLVGQEMSRTPAASSRFRWLASERFSAGNARLCEQFKISPKGLVSEETVVAAPVCDMERFFSFETQMRLQEISLLMQSPATLKPTTQQDQAINKARSWWSWVIASGEQ